MPTWQEKAELFHNPADPLEHTTGHYTVEHSPCGRFCEMRFHAWDINREAYEERLAAGPATLSARGEVIRRRPLSVTQV